MYYALGEKMSGKVSKFSHSAIVKLKTGCWRQEKKRKRKANPEATVCICSSK